jgi:hypothetical protein
MERFKALEKEMKMKAFSKEGLIAQSKLDPAEKAKKDLIDWIGTTVDELSRQIEQTEAEMEAVQGGSKKKKAMGEKMSELEELNERRVWHNSKLEIVQRMLENGQLSVDQVEVIQEDVKYFVEANAVSPPLIFRLWVKLTVGRRKTLITTMDCTRTSICRKRTNTCRISRITTIYPTSIPHPPSTLLNPPHPQSLPSRHPQKNEPAPSPPLHQPQGPRLYLQLPHRKNPQVPSWPKSNHRENQRWIVQRQNYRQERRKRNQYHLFRFQWRKRAYHPSGTLRP